MGKIGYGYGSEWQLLWYLARHRAELNTLVCAAVDAERIDWLDFPRRGYDGRFVDGEWKGLDFLTDARLLEQWREFWPQRAGVQNWDAVARIQVDGCDEWLLVEAKGHCAEVGSSCGAKPEGGLSRIKQALDETKRALGVNEAKDWMSGYYQFCNRVAVLHFLQSRSVGARLLFVYFTGDSAVGRDCPGDEAAWRPALAEQDAHVGLPENHAWSRRIHKLFLPAFANLHEPSPT